MRFNTISLRNPKRILKDIIATILILWSVSAFSQGYTSQSVLADGDIYKISSDRAGIYKLSYSFLSDALNISLESVDPRNIRLFGNGNSMLPENIDEERIDDLKEIQIHVSGEEDGRFDVQDYILFYGQPADKRIWDSSRNIFSVETNIYSDRVYYFLKIGDAPGQRIQTIEETGSPEYVSTGFDAFLKYEKEEINLLNDFVSTSGTGQNWYGDLFKGIRQRDYSDKFIFPNLISSDAGHVKVVFASRSDATTALKVKIEGQEFSRLIGSVDLSDPEGRYARIGIIEESFNAQGDNLNIQLDFPQINGNSTGWLDLIEVNARRAIRYENQPLIFSDHHTQQFATSQIIIETLNPQLKVWDISNPLQPISIITNHTQNRTSFNASTSLLRTFIAFNEDQSLTPVALGQLPNQNLHGLDGINMLIVHPSNLEEQAQQLANHRMLHSGISVETIRIEEIFNEFASGSPDVTAIRDFAKMLYDRNEGFKYLLLFGDATFDFKNIAGLSPSLNLVPTYETRESLDPIRGFPTDDYFGLLTSGEGADLKGALDIAIGRLPAKNEQEAIVLVNKIINYDTNPGYQDSWLNQLTFIADDEDFNIHINQADQIAESFLLQNPEVNIDKIYLDAFQQVSTAGGELYPSVTQAINTALLKGTSVINYMGHGGSSGLAQERILTINDVDNWNNNNKLALFVTATCSFTAFDDPNFVTAGERAILNPNGGAIALFTTVRAVYSSSNERLTRAVFDHLYQPVNSIIPPIGEILRKAKNSNPADTIGINSRKFLLIGDPSMNLARPELEVVTEFINDHDLSDGVTDTLSALQPVMIKGFIAQDGNWVNDFNGELDVIIFDKPQDARTLAQDNTSFEKTFASRKNIIFKGKVSIDEGRFEFSFIVPSDIDYSFGQGKISYYANDGTILDAKGFYNKIVIGGSADVTVADDQGPEIEVFLDDENFISGGITSPNPTLLIKLKDDYGINIVGNSIGHDITAVLDEETKNTFVLNEFYESELDNNTAGTVRFPLFDLKEGNHSIKVKAWDIANNSSEATTRFIVAFDATSALDQVLNYPNPMTDFTTFRIDHKLTGSLLDITIEIFSSNGQLVKTIEQSSVGGTGIVDGIQWDGRSEIGTILPNGIYLYKVIIKENSQSDENNIISELERLVILR